MVNQTFCWRMRLKWSSHSWSLTLSEWASVACKYNNKHHQQDRSRLAIIWKTTLLDFCFREGLAQVHHEDLRGKLPRFSCMLLMAKYPTEWQRLLTLMTSRKTTAWPSAPYCRYKWCHKPGAAWQGPREGRCMAVQQHLKVLPDWRTNKHTLEQTEAGEKNFMRPLTEAAWVATFPQCFL